MFFALEGLPGSGKTTIIDNLNCNRFNISIVEQIIDHDNNLDDPAGYYFCSDLLKYKKAADFLKEGKKVVMDRSYFSTLAYFYAFDEIFKTDNYNILIKKYNKKSFKIAQSLIFIGVNINNSLVRKNRKSTSDYIWCNKEFLLYMQDFYDKEINKLADNIIYLDGNKNFKEIFKEILKIINE